jgi:hypothetical protein
LHTHMAMYLSIYVSVTGKPSDTCWANGSQCTVMNRLVRKHGPTDTSCPGSTTTTALNKSGGVGSSPSWIPYLCQTWSAVSRSPDEAAFDAH